MFTWLLCVLPLALAAPSEYIIGGTPVTDENRHPWQGSLQFLSGHTCGCVLLTASYAITAAHCTDGRDGDPSRFEMRFGTVFWADGGFLYSVSTITPHPDYDDNSGGFVPHDVCILEPGSGIQGTGVDLDTNNPENDCWISGWGVDTVGGGSVTEQLNEADMDIMGDAACQAIWGTSFDADVHICITSENNDKGSCNGDSGGPLVCDHGASKQLRGVTSWGISGCSPTFPSVYARIYNSGVGTNLKTWICDNTDQTAGGC